MSLSSIPKSLRNRVFDRDGGRCQYCQLAQIGQGTIFHINHVIPRSKGGPTDEDNLALQCPHCSLHKSDRVTAIDPDSGDSAALFHPRLQRWTDHFSLEGSGICRGMTPIGRATVEALRMNDPLPRIARALQIGLGLLAVQ